MQPVLTLKPVEAHRKCTAMLLLLTGVLVTGCSSVPVAPEPLALTQVIYSDDGLSQLPVPSDWAIRPDFGRDAAIRVAEGNGKSSQGLKKTF